jgi:hypothetical protein
MVNYGVLISAVLFGVAALIPDHPHNDDSKAFLFLLGSAAYCIGVVFEVVRALGG